MTRKPADVIIVGGGVVGLSVAYVLSTEGLQITLLDRSALGREASWAGAGIISPGPENPPSSPSAALRALSDRLHEQWSLALLEQTGLDNGYRRCGGVDVALSDTEDHDLRSLAGRWRQEGITFERLLPHDFTRVEPLLSPSLLCAYFLPDRAQIRNPRHLQALEAACRLRGVTLLPHCPAVGFSTQNHRITQVHTADASFPCSQVVVAAGPWTEALLAPLGLPLQTPPVRGQIVLLNTGRPTLLRIVEHGHRYLVPRDDGRILVGSTEEHAGFDSRTTAQGIHTLLDESLSLCPTLAQAEIERTWAGLRPGSLDGKPYLGAHPLYPNLFVASGHQRTGLQLSPGTAQLLGDLVLNRPPSLDLSPFRLDRPPSPSDEPFRS